MKSGQHLIGPVKFILLLYQSHVFQFLQQLGHHFIKLLLIRKKLDSLFFQLDIASYLNFNIGGPKQKARSERRMVRFQEAQIINPLLGSFQFAFQVNFRFFADKIIIAIASFKIESDAFIVIIIIGQVFLYGVIQAFHLCRNTVGRDETSFAKYIKYFFGIFHGHSLFHIQYSSSGINQRVLHFTGSFVSIRKVKFIGILRSQLAEKD